MPKLTFIFEQPQHVSRKEVCEMLAPYCPLFWGKKIRQDKDYYHPLGLKSWIFERWLLDSKGEWVVNVLGPVTREGCINNRYELCTTRQDFNEHHMRLIEELFKLNHGYHGMDLKLTTELVAETASA